MDKDKPIMRERFIGFVSAVRDGTPFESCPAPPVAHARGAGPNDLVSFEVHDWPADAGKWYGRRVIVTIEVMR